MAIKYKEVRKVDSCPLRVGDDGNDQKDFWKDVSKKTTELQHYH